MPDFSLILFLKHTTPAVFPKSSIFKNVSAGALPIPAHAINTCHSMSDAPGKQMNKDLILRERLAIQRTVMANHTTLLSFIRTALYFSVAGLTLHNLLDVRFGLLIEIVCWIIAAVILITGIVNYKRHQQKIRESERHVGDYQLDYEKDL